MHRHVVTVLVMLCIIILVTMHYLIYATKAGQRKPLMLRDWGLRKIYQWGRWNGSWDADIFLDEYQKWGPQSLQRPFILHQMFCHVTIHGKREHDRAIHWGQRQPSPKWHLKAEVPTMDLVQPTMLQADIRNIYNDVYQLRRLLGEIPCDNAIAKKICQSILRICEGAPLV